jgi:hypothetical protein
MIAMLSINDIITVLGEAQTEGEIDPATFVALLTRFNVLISARPVAEALPARRERVRDSGLVLPTAESAPRGSDSGNAVDRMEAIEVIPYPATDGEAPLGKLAKGAPVGGYTPKDITPAEE